MTESTASCLKKGDIVLHKHYHIKPRDHAVVERVEPRKDCSGFWVVLQQLDVPMSPVTLIGEPPKEYRVLPDDLQVVVARRPM